ncbi:hypothetical protein [Sorangium sp. So ce1000]|uniref:hypothetical protein n=1 Tax=Sorangium sp. So ce1000 TaxID=3133325 RepID=UPI003F611587
MPINVELSNANLLDSNRTQIVKFEIRGATFRCDLPSSYSPPVQTTLQALAQGGWGTGLQWHANLGNFAIGEITVTVESVDGTFTGSNAAASGANFNTIHVAIDKHAVPPVNITFT